MAQQPKILVCPLNWGIGHASRLVPVIRSLLHQGAAVYIGASGNPGAFLKGEFPDLPFIDFPGYDITYPGTGWGMAMKMMQHAPALLRSIKKEHAALDKLIRKYGFSGVVSDNRYGLYSDKIPSVFITHQVFIRTPWHLSFLQPIIARLNRGFIDRFNTCWVPDNEGENNLSGALSHKRPLPDNFRFIGPLSRFDDMMTPNQHNNPGPPSYDLLVLLSGPEPQRSILEEKVRDQVKSLGIKVALVRGKPGSGDKPGSIENIDAYNHLESLELLSLMNTSRLVLARSGYSTIMDLAATGKKAILIPTPGQTEQEYLGKYLGERGHFLVSKQDKLNLKEDLARAERHPGLARMNNGAALNKCISELLGTNQGADLS